MLPDLRDILNQLNLIPLPTYVLLFFATSSLLVLMKDWRISIIVLLFQYLIMGIVLARLIRPEIAFAKVLVGLFICCMLYLSARQAGWRRYLTATNKYVRDIVTKGYLTEPYASAGFTFRLMALLLMGVITFALTQTYPLMLVPIAVSVAIYWLCLSGLLLLLLTEEPFKAGQGLLCIVIGFELWYSVLDNRLLFVGMWGSVNLFLALVIGYLTTVRSVVLEENF